MENDPFDVLVQGSFGPDALRVNWTSEMRTTTPDLERLIAQAWRRKQRQVQARGGRLFPGPLCRLVGYRVQDGALWLSLGPTDYRDLVGTNLSHPELWRSLGFQCFSNALAVHASVTTADHLLLIYRRSTSLADHPGYYDVCGGHLDPVLDQRDSVPDPYAAMLRELREETGIPPDRVRSAICRGLVRSRLAFKPDLVFDVATSLSSAELSSLPLDEEHAGLTFLPDQPDAIARFLRDHPTGLAPAGNACLQLHHGARQ